MVSLQRKLKESEENQIDKHPKEREEIAAENKRLVKTVALLQSNIQHLQD